MQALEFSASLKVKKREVCGLGEPEGVAVIALEFLFAEILHSSVQRRELFAHYHHGARLPCNTEGWHVNKTGATWVRWCARTQRHTQTHATTTIATPI